MTVTQRLLQLQKKRPQRRLQMQQQQPLLAFGVQA